MSPSHILYQQQPCNSDIPYNTITPRSPKRSASFSPHVRVKRTLHINNYSDDEVEATWYGDSDFQRIHDEINYTVDLIEKSEHIDTSKYCTRGLEFRTRAGAQQRRRNKIDARNATLDEQDFQWTEGLNDPDMLSKVYQRKSHTCLVAAHMAGLMDEKVARGLDARAGLRRSRKRNDSVVYRFLHSHQRTQ